MERATRAGFFVPAIAIAVMLALVTPAAAHTEFDRSVPAEGETVRGPLRQIELIYTNAATEAGEGFVVRDAELGRIEPDEVDNPRTGVFVLRFNDALSPGEVGVRWTVRAPDTHPISGAFAFELRERGAAGAAGGTTPSGGDGGTLQEFLSEDSRSEAGEVLARIGRAVTFIGLAAALGFSIFAFVVMRGSLRELHSLLGWIRFGGILVVLGTLVDAAGQVMVDSGGLAGLVDPGAWSDSWSTNLGVAWVLRLAGGGLVAFGARGEIADPEHPHRDPIRSISEALPAAAAAPQATASAGDPERRDARLRLNRQTLPLALGVGVLLLTSHGFDGHTVNEGNRLLTSFAAAAHVLAGSIWAAGIVALAWIIRGRKRRREPIGGLVLAARFSVLAALALATVAVVGVYLSVVILDSPSVLWRTDWGLLLIAKVAVVGVAAAIGGYNHFRLIPQIDSSGQHPAAVARLGRSLRGEAALMVIVVILSAVLVRASSVS